MIEYMFEHIGIVGVALGILPDLDAAETPHEEFPEHQLNGHDLVLDENLLQAHNRTEPQ